MPRWAIQIGIGALACIMLGVPGCQDDDDSAAASPDPIVLHGWQIQLCTSGFNFTSISAIDDGHVFVTGLAQGVYSTADGGATWDKLSNKACNTSQFVDSKNGWGAFWATSDHRLVSTSDGGATWTQVLNDASNRMSFVSATTGWIANSDGSLLMRTTDAGSTWSSTAFEDPVALVHFTDEQNGWVVTSSTETVTLLNSTNGGATWQERYRAPRSKRTPLDIAVVGATHVWVAFKKFVIDGYKTALLASADGGTTWTEQEWEVIGIVKALHFATENIGWAAGSKIYRTEDGGATWSLQTLPPGPYGSATNPFGGFYDIRFLDEKTGWAVGDNGLIMKTTNGGQ